MVILKYLLAAILGRWLGNRRFLHLAALTINGVAC